VNLDFGLLLQLVASGLAVGGIYAFIAVGFVTIHAVTGCINFAQGEFAMLGALVSAATVQRGLPLAVAAVLGVGAALVGALAVDRAAYEPVRTRSPLVVLVMTVAASGILRGLALLLFGTSPLSMAAFSGGPPYAVGGTVIGRQDVWVLGLTGAGMALLFLFFSRTSVGIAMRAAAANPTASRLVGVSTSASAGWLPCSSNTISRWCGRSPLASS
jgi:branched-chain amino acid transport system permease protein